MGMLRQGETVGYWGQVDSSATNNFNNLVAVIGLRVSDFVRFLVRSA